jgi:hypothetical protein
MKIAVSRMGLASVSLAILCRMVTLFSLHMSALFNTHATT